MPQKEAVMECGGASLSRANALTRKRFFGQENILQAALLNRTLPKPWQLTDEEQKNRHFLFHLPGLLNVGPELGIFLSMLPTLGLWIS